MTAARSSALRPAIVLARDEQGCTVIGTGAPRAVLFASFFPSPRTDRVSPGHLVAVAEDVVVWRWFDAVVLHVADDEVRLWEPGHGEVLARPRNAAPGLVPGSRAYLSAGLPGAEWWVEGPTTRRAGDAVVDLGAVDAFLAEHGLTVSPSGAHRP